MNMRSTALSTGFPLAATHTACSSKREAQISSRPAASLRASISGHRFHLDAVKTWNKSMRSLAHPSHALADSSEVASELTVQAANLGTQDQHEIQIRLISKEEHHGGQLEVVRLGPSCGDEAHTYPSVSSEVEERVLRVWTPPGFHKNEGGEEGWPVMYLNDGQNLFSSQHSLSGSCWSAGKTVAKLIADGQIPPVVVVGLDHAGDFRALDYLPAPPGAGVGAMFPDYGAAPGGGVHHYLARLVDVVMPACSQRYGCARGGDRVFFGGSSFGGIAAIYAGMKYPEMFGGLLVESPSLWMAEGEVLLSVASHSAGGMPARVAVGFGGREHSDARQGPGDDADNKMVEYTESYVQMMRERGDVAVQYVLDLEAAHSEAAWAQRLPGHIQFLLAPLLDKPPEPTDCNHNTPSEDNCELEGVASKPEILLATSSKEEEEMAAAKVASEAVSMSYEKTETDSEDTLAWTAEEAAHFAGNVQDAPFCCRPYPLAPGQKGVVYLNKAKSMLGHGNALRMVGAYNSWQIGEFDVEMVECDLPNLGGADWRAAVVDVPSEAIQMNFCFSNEHNQWDNNEDENYIINVEDPAIRAPIPEQDKDALDAKALELVGEKGESLFFTCPEPLVPGQPGAVYFNKKKSWTLKDSSVRFFGGFNSWSLGTVENVMDLTPGMPQGWDVEWLNSKFNVPEGAFDFSLAFSNEEQTVFDNNDDNDYVARVASKQARPPRTIKEIESYEHAGGLMEIVRLDARPGASRRSKWKEERMIRVWTPPGYNAEHYKNSEHGIPVLFMNDGKNLYEDWLAHQGVSWNAGHCAAGLIECGALPPFMIVGIDSPGPFRSQCYLPWPPGEGKWGHRPDAARWPGGDAMPYMERVTQELIPLIESQWGGSSNPDLRCFGGASFGGVCALFASMHFNEYFTSFLCESPSLWSQEGKFLGDMYHHKGSFGKRMFLGVGTKEHSYNHDEWLEIDHLILGYAQEANRILEDRGVHSHSGDLAFQVDEGAGHVEGAWGHRLGGSLQFLCKHWWSYFQ